MKKQFFFLSVILFWSTLSFAWEDPTGGKPFFPWLWEDQFKPTIERSADGTGLGILAAGAVGTIAAHQEDVDFYQRNQGEDKLIMDDDTATAFSRVGSGALGVSVALLQTYLDQKNGLMHLRAIALTSLTHVTIAAGFQRERPGGRGDYLPFPSSFPSGHTSSAFATAGSLSYAYGWKAGVPAYLLATGISLARLNENAHWLSDVVAGAAIGIYWARASALAEEEKTESTFNWMPVPLPGGMMISLEKRF